MDKAKILERLKSDEDYYGEFGKQFLSNSNVSTLLNSPLSLGKAFDSSPALLIGGYFHTAILEPDKLNKFKIIESSTRNTKMYKEMSEGELCLLQHEVDKIELMTEKLLANDVCRGLIRGDNVEYEVPGIKEIEGNWWKGKADIINHDEKLIIDLKTTADINKFKNSAFKYNYDSQSYIYSSIFGYEMLFIAIDKSDNQIGLFDCSPEFIKRGADKVVRASNSYDLFFKTEGFDPTNYFINKTL
jgi:hypothetical protein